MVEIAPFRALRYDAEVAGGPQATSAPPYDALDRFRYASHRTANPYTVVELITHSPDGGYDAARATYDRWRRTGVLVEDPDPALYLYEQHELRHGVPAVLRGVVGVARLGPLTPGSPVLPHEAVEPDRVGDRLARLLAVPVELTPVMAFHVGGTADLDRPAATARRRQPTAAFTDEAGVDHRVWRIPPAAARAVRRGLAEVQVVLADGHHRVATAIARARHLGADPAAASTLMMVVDAAAGGLQLRPVHRLVRAWDQQAAGPWLREQFREIVWRGTETELAEAVSAAPGLAFGLVQADRAVLLRARDPAGLRAALDPARSARWRALDAAVLDDVVLPAVGGSGVERLADVTAAADEVAHDRAAALLLLAPPAADDVVALAREGERMPAKTTWFRPKPRAGLLMRALDVP